MLNQFYRTVTVLWFVSMLACSASDVRREIDMGPDASENTEETVLLRVEQPDRSTSWKSIPIMGEGPANGTLFYETQNGGRFNQKLGESGTFCINVFLSSNMLNTIKFEASNESGIQSKPIIIEVRQEGEPPENAANGAPKAVYANIASNAIIRQHSVSVEEGKIEALVDSDTTGEVHLQNSINKPDWLVIELNESLPIKNIRLHSSIECPMENYRVLLNKDSESGDPIEASAGSNSYGEGWVMVAEIEDGKPSQTIVPVVEGQVASRMAIEFLSWDCWSLTGGVLHKLTEIEVWGQRTQSRPGEGQQNCPGN